MSGKKLSIFIDMKGKGIEANYFESSYKDEGDHKTDSEGVHRDTGYKEVRVNGQKARQTSKRRSNNADKPREKITPTPVVILKGLYADNNPIYLGPRVTKSEEQKPKTNSSRT
ncbi:uncharacterized protein LOC144438419 [Glandiceps talaboti]